MSIKDYVRDTRAELKHVNWPTRAQTVAYSIAVVVISLLVALILGAGDSVFSSVIRKIIGA